MMIWSPVGVVLSVVVAPLEHKLEYPKIGYVSLALAPSRSVVPFHHHRFVRLLGFLYGICLSDAQLRSKIRRSFIVRIMRKMHNHA